MKTIACIPARYSSSRLPGKPLMKIGNKSMIEHVWTKVNQHSEIDEAIVLTDDTKIFKHCRSFGANAVMTSTTCKSGTDRILEVRESLDADIILNIQGDEPMISEQKLNKIIKLMQKKEVEIGTLCRPIITTEELFDYNRVKAIFTKNNKVLYFSRQAIPSVALTPQKEWINKTDYYLHLGIYGFKSSVLDKISAFNISKLELAESLEQLRWLENGLEIYIDILTEDTSISVDTMKDLDKVRKMLRSTSN